MSATTPEPSAILDKDKVTSLLPDVDPAWVELYTDAVNAEVADLAPAGVPAGVAGRVRLLLLSAIQQAAMTKPWLASETTGPYAVVYRSGARPGGLLTSVELAELRRLLGITTEASSGPRFSFPAAGSYNSLFEKPFPSSAVAAAGGEWVLGGYADALSPSASDAVPTTPAAPTAGETVIVEQVQDVDSGITQEQLDAL